MRGRRQQFVSRRRKFRCKWCGSEPVPKEGMEWREVPIGATIYLPRPPSEPYHPDAAVKAFLARDVRPATVHQAVRRAKIETVEQVEAMSDEQLLAHDGIGQRTLELLRELADAQNPCPPGAVVR
jgi:hypothetical protein